MNDTEIRVTQLIPVDQLRPAADNVRQEVGDVRELANSIREVGLLTPLLVAAEGDHYIIVAGHRRITALKSLRWTQIPCVVLPALKDADRIALMMIENTQRVDINPIERGLAYKKMLDQGLTQKEVARRIGVNFQTVTRYLALLELPPEDQDRLRSGKLSANSGYDRVKAYRRMQREALGIAPRGRPVEEWEECEHCWGRGKVRRGTQQAEPSRYAGVPGCLNCTAKRLCFKHQREKAEAELQELSRLRAELEGKKGAAV